MQTDYINRQDAVNAVAFGITNVTAINKETGERIDLFARENEELQSAIKRIHDLSSADVVDVIRCKECLYYHPSYCEVWSKYGTVQTRENGYCYMAERREGRKEQE